MQVLSIYTFSEYMPGYSCLIQIYTMIRRTQLDCLSGNHVTRLPDHHSQLLPSTMKVVVLLALSLALATAAGKSVLNSKEKVYTIQDSLN